MTCEFGSFVPDSGIGRTAFDFSTPPLPLFPPCGRPPYRMEAWTGQTLRKWNT